MKKEKENNKKKIYAKKYMRPPGREPTICGLIDNRANHFVTESAANMENY